MANLKTQIYRLLEPGESGDSSSQAVDGALILLILLNAIAAILETVPSLARSYGPAFQWFEIGSVSVFTLEYALRIWSCTVGGTAPVWGRVRFALRPMQLIDLVAILPFYLVFLGVDLRTARVLRLARFFRIAKLWRYSAALKLLGRAVAHRREELLMTLMLGLFALVISATLIYYAESAVQPEVFSSIPASFWWAVTTLTTVGYGDAYPLTGFGKVVGGIVQIIGIALFALPTGLVSSSLMEHIQSRRAELGDTPPYAATCPHCGKALA